MFVCTMLCIQLFYSYISPGEEDYDGYDISRLRKPNDMDTFDRFEPLQAERYGKRGIAFS